MSGPLPAAARRVQDALRELGLDVPIRLSATSARTAQEAASAVGAEVGAIVKSLVFLAGGRPVLALVSGANRLSPERLSALADGDVERAPAGLVRDVTGYAIGGIPPVGHARPLRTFCDEDLLRYETVWAAAGTPNAVFPVAPADLVRASGAVVGVLKDPGDGAGG